MKTILKQQLGRFRIAILAVMILGSESIPADVPGKSDRVLIPILSLGDAHEWKSDLGSNFGSAIWSKDAAAEEPEKKVRLKKRLVWAGEERCLSLQIDNFSSPGYYASFWVSVFGNSRDREIALPDEIAKEIKAVRFMIRSVKDEIPLTFEAKTAKGKIADLALTATGTWKTHEMPLDKADGLKELSFVFKSGDTPESFGVQLRDLAFVSGGSLRIPTGGAELVEWARDRGLHYFIWNYREPAPGMGIILERNSFRDLISTASIGYGFPSLIVAEKQGLITGEQTLSRVRAMLRWLDGIDCEGDTGGGGSHGFPAHFLNLEGKTAGESEASTIDWAICASGIRVARQRFSGDAEVQSLTKCLLSRADWSAALTKNGRLSHGFDAEGEMLASEWGSSFTEEAHIVALEAVASGKVDADVFNNIAREEKGGFWPSWFGSGFTYNWLQLWTGPFEPLASNSKAAFGRDVRFCKREFGTSLFGLTACETYSRKDDSGFLRWDKYLGEIGPDIHLAGDEDVHRWAVCPYGAALAIPFLPNEAEAALSKFAEMGFAHPLLGFADSVRMKKLPAGVKSPIPNWTQFAIDVAPMWMSIEAASKGGGRVAELYLKDETISTNVKLLKRSLLAELPGPP